MSKRARNLVYGQSDLEDDSDACASVNCKTVDKEHPVSCWWEDRVFFMFRLDLLGDPISPIVASKVEERRGQPFDIVICLKLTKWVHLHWGDDGVRVSKNRQAGEQTCMDANAGHRILTSSGESLKRCGLFSTSVLGVHL